MAENNLTLEIELLRGEYSSDEIEKIQQRYYMLMAVLDGCKITTACKKFNIDRTSYYKWQKRYYEKGLEGLVDRPPVHNNHPQQIDEATVEQIIRMALLNPEHDCKIIKSKLDGLYKIKISHVTVNKYLKKYGLHTWTLRSSNPLSREEDIINELSWNDLHRTLGEIDLRVKPKIIKSIATKKGELIRINIPPYNNAVFHIRKWFCAGNDTEGNAIFKPTKYGVSFTLSMIDELVDAMKEIEIYISLNKIIDEVIPQYEQKKFEEAEFDKKTDTSDKPQKKHPWRNYKENSSHTWRVSEFLKNKKK